MRSSSRLLALCVVPLALAGCANVKLYSDVRDKQATEAADAWKKVDLKALIATERGNLDKLLEAELATQDRVVAGIRDHSLRGMVLSARPFKETVQDPLLRELQATAGTTTPTYLTATIANARQEASLKRMQDGRRVLFEQNGLAMPDCASLVPDKTPPDIQAWLNKKPADGTRVTNAMKMFRALCTPSAGAPPKESAIHKAMQERDAARMELKQLRTEATALRKAYEDALASHQAAVKDTEVGEPTRAQRIAARAEDLQRATNALEKADNALAKDFLSQQRIDKIQAFVTAVTETPPGSAPPPDASELAAVFIVVPSLLDDARKSLREARKPLAVPLLIRLNHEKLNQEAARRDIASQEQVVRLSEELVEARMLQATELNLARMELDLAGVAPGTSLADAFMKAGTARQPDALWRGTARYLDARNRLEARIRKIEYRRIGAYHDRALAYAEVNAQQWDSLIGNSVEQQVAYGKSGIKAENLTAIINSLGLLWIGAGVNK
jgi:hypothetical protein